MSVSSQGKFCESCQRHLIDFTRKSEEEINEIISTDSAVCGRFRNEQLNQDTPAKLRFSLPSFFRSGFLASLFLGVISTFYGCSDEKKQIQDSESVDSDADVKPTHTLGIPLPRKNLDEKVLVTDTIDAHSTSQKSHQSKS